MTVSTQLKVVIPLIVKRIFDVIVASLMLVLTLPLFLVSALVVRLTSKGPALFAHTRCGRHGVPFKCLKFRTMVVDAQDWLEKDSELRAKYKENGFKLQLEQDPRITKVGRLLRLKYVDELPQLLNVIRGEMSLVGPRPIVEEELERYGDQKDELLSVRPGIFGPWTVWGRARPDYPDRTLLELDYITDTAWAKDLRILLRHIPVLLVGQEKNVPTKRRGRVAQESVSAREA